MINNILTKGKTMVNKIVDTFKEKKGMDLIQMMIIIGIIATFAVIVVPKVLDNVGNRADDSLTQLDSIEFKAGSE